MPAMPARPRSRFNSSLGAPRSLRLRRKGSRPPAPMQERLTVVRDIAATAALLLLPAFALRVLVVARWDREVATALIVNSETAQLLYASLLVAIQVALYLGPVIAAYYFVLWARRRDWPIWRAFAGLLALWIASFPGLLMMPANYLSPFLPLIGILVFANVAQDRDDGEIPARLVPAFQVALVGFLFVVLILASTAMWLPRERLDVAGTPKHVYVLGDSGQDVVVFDPKAHAVIRIPEKDVSNRQFCYQKDFQTFAQVIFGKPHGLPECP